MVIKDYFKRVFTYVVKGVPNINVDVNVGQISSNNLLAGQQILITGGGRGLGFEMAKKCINSGAKVIISGRNKSVLERASDQLGPNCNYSVFDMTNIHNISSFVDKIFLDYKTIDAVICNAGISLHEDNILDVTIDNFEKQLQTNLEGNYFLVQSYIKNNLNKNLGGNIIFISSERGLQCDDLPYGLSKAALNSLTRGLSRRFYKKGFRVNAIAPGITASEMTGRKSTENLFANELSSGRFFIAEEIAEVVAFILSDASKCISGEIIACDAGNYIGSYF